MTGKARKRYGAVPPLAVNWSDDFEYELAFKTSIIESRNGIEQRMAMRVLPRVTMSYRSTVRDAAFSRLGADLIGGQNREWFVKVPFRRVAVTESRTLGSSVITVEGYRDWMQPGVYIITETDDFVHVSQIDTWESETSRIILQETADVAIPAGAQVYYAHKVVYAETASVDLSLSRLAEHDTQFAAVPGNELTDPVVSISPEQFLGHDVFSTRPNWADEPEFEYLADRRVVDSDRGVWDLASVRPFVIRNMSFQYLLRTQSAAEVLIAFFYRHRGKRGQFWASSHAQDITLRQAVSAGAQSFETFDRDWFDAIKNSTVYNVLVLPDGQRVRISDVSLTAEGNTEFDLQETLDSPLDPTSRVSFLTLCRFASDALKIDWRTDGVGECALTFTPLPNL